MLRFQWRFSFQPKCGQRLILLFARAASIAGNQRAGDAPQFFTRLSVSPICHARMISLAAGW